MYTPQKAQPPPKPSWPIWARLLVTVCILIVSLVATGYFAQAMDQQRSEKEQAALATQEAILAMQDIQLTVLPWTPTKTSATGLFGNPWGFDHNPPGNLIDDPPLAFCEFFPCIANFWNGKGYVVECVDGKFSKSGGRQGVCSQHGGDKRPLYSH